MTGDGVNDAPALAQGDLGIAIGSGTDVATETADIILVNSNLEDVVSLIDFGKATYRKIVQNLIWATKSIRKGIKNKGVKRKNIKNHRFLGYK